MRTHLPLVISLVGAAILFLSIAFVTVLVVLTYFDAGLEFTGGHELAAALSPLAR